MYISALYRLVQGGVRYNKILQLIYGTTIG